ncbi:MAG TPA: glycosyltransferase family 2 protein [Thermoanaerobaculia bacterium]|nr:glycosyltransferase family 2 protein [Thermoanaerobaculia bacterium]
MPEEKVLVVIPALDAQATIGRIVSEAREVLSDVLVVDDGSSDGTGQQARAAGATVLRHEINQGKGAALTTAFEWALERGYDAVITLDADGQHLPAEIPRFIEQWQTEGSDLIIGSRRHLFAGMVRRRRAANVFSANAISFAAGRKVDDPQSGFRLYSSRLLRNVKLEGTRFDAESEVIVRAGRGGFKITSIPIALAFVDGLQTSHYRALLDTLRITWRVLKTRIEN